MPAGRSLHRYPVTVDLHGGEIRLAVHEITGARDGPTLAVLSTLHGGEWLSIEMVRRLVTRLDPKAMSGRVLAVPVGNPVALTHLTRNTPDESDSADLNRIFPGQFTWIADLLAKAITEHVLKPCQYLIDMHLGLWGSSFYTVVWPKDLPDPEQVRKAGVMAQAFGCPMVFHRNTVTWTWPSRFRSTVGTGFYTIDVKSNGPVSERLLLSALAMGSFQYPPVYTEQAGLLRGFCTRPIGTGPYMSEVWR